MVVTKKYQVHPRLDRRRAVRRPTAADVAMGVDETRHDDLAGHVVDFRAARNLHVVDRACLLIGGYWYCSVRSCMPKIGRQSQPLLRQLPRPHPLQQQFRLGLGVTRRRFPL